MSQAALQSVVMVGYRAQNKSRFQNFYISPLPSRAPPPPNPASALSAATSPLPPLPPPLLLHPI